MLYASRVIKTAPLKGCPEGQQRIKQNERRFKINMKFSFRKIGSILASGAMLSSTVALAAAASFPAPFVAGGTADVAIVHGGANAAFTDLVAVMDIRAALGDKLASNTASGSSGSVSVSAEGENFPLFTTSSELFMNSTLKSVRETLGSSNMPVLLKDYTFEGDVTATYEQRIIIGGNPVITFAEQPSDTDDPQLGIAIGTSAKTANVYNATVTFDNVVNFSLAASQGESITLFGVPFTVGSATTATKLVLLRSSDKVYLTSDDPSSTVSVDGNEYAIDLVSASSNAATVKITDSTGKSEQREVSEAASRKMLGVEVTVDDADSNNLRYVASVSVGTGRITLQDGNAVKTGTDEDLIDGTNVEFENSAGGSETSTAVGKLVFQVAAADSQTDAIVPGQAFIDPIFGSFKIDFTGVTSNIGDSDRRDILVSNSGNDKMTVSFQSHDGTAPVVVNWAYNKSDADDGGAMDLADNGGDRIIVAEMAPVNQSDYFVIANDDEGGLYEVTQITNSSSSTASDDSITLKNIFTGTSNTYKADTEGQGTFTAQGKTVTFTYFGDSTVSNGRAMRVRFNQAESGGNDVIFFPTIKTETGAKIMFVEPTTVNLGNWDGLNNAVSNIKIQDGDGYSNIVFVKARNDTGMWNVTVGGGTLATINTSAGADAQIATGTIGKLTFKVASTATINNTVISLLNPESGNANITRPSLVLFEEKDDANNYEAAVVTLDAGYDGDSAGLGVGDVVRTWGADTQLGNEIQLETNSDLYQDIDIWGTIFELDKSDSDQTKARINYPDNQIEALVYVAETDATITTSGGGATGGSVKELGSVAITDAEVGSASGKNLIVVGGSCVNSVAASLLNVATSTCGADWTAATGIASGEYLIETFSRTGDKIATLVAGYNAGDTTNAAKALTTQTVDTSAGKKYKGTSATAIEAVMEAAAA